MLVALAVEGRELRLVLDEIVLTILHDHLVVESSEGHHSLSFWLGIFISIFHFLLSLVHVGGTDRLDFVVEGAREDILGVFDIEARAVVTSVAMGVLRSTIMILVAELAHEHRVEILVLVGMLVTRTLVVHVLLKLFVREIEGSPIGHVHFETARSEGLCLMLVDSSNLLFGVGD